MSNLQGLACVCMLLAAAWLVAGCEDKPQSHSHGDGHNHAQEPAAGSTHKGHEGHAHVAPNGGTLVELGDDAAQLEIVLDGASGEVRAYVLDGCAEKAVRIAQPAIELSVRPRERGGAPVADSTAIALKLAAVESALSGEKAGDTSAFAGKSDVLVGVSKIDGTVIKIAVRGEEWLGVQFSAAALAEKRP